MVNYFFLQKEWLFSADEGNKIIREIFVESCLKKADNSGIFERILIRKAFRLFEMKWEVVLNQFTKVEYALWSKSTHIILL